MKSLIETTFAKVSIALVAIAITLSMLLQGVPNADSAAFTGSAAFLKSQATSSVSTSAKTLFAENQSCKSRVITTYGSSINLIFGAKTSGISTSSVSATVGHSQASSTTVAYDSGIYGCGEWSVYSPSTQVITISEF